MLKSYDANPMQIVGSEISEPIGVQEIRTSGGSRPNRFKRKLFDFFNNGSGHKLSSVFIDIHFTIWKLRHPGSKFSDYYAGSISAELKRGRTHKTLGSKRFLSGSLAADPIEHDLMSQSIRGMNHFNAAIRLGLRPEHTCIDYGCGSLRVGQHIMKYLEPGRYWGLDIVSDFYESGKTLLPPDLMNQKRPELHVIGPGILRAARKSGPDFIVSFAVLKHVPPAELDAYFENIACMMAPHSKAVITFNEAKHTTRTGAKIWDYCREEIIASLQCRNAGIKCTVSPYSKKAESSGLPQTSILLIERDVALLSSGQGTWGAC
jgi:hypothetical protein